MSGTRVVLDPKLVGETRTYSFTFELPVGVTISTQACTASTFSGTDLSPSSIIGGAASASGNVVSQLITAGTSGVLYDILCTITTSDSQTLLQSGYLAVIQNL